MLSGEATKTNFIVFGLTQSGLELTIYHTRGKHAYHQTTDVVELTRWVTFGGSGLKRGGTTVLIAYCCIVSCTFQEYLEENKITPDAVLVTHKHW